jgi:ABC-type sugar transport system substrate-binding protein
VTQKPPAYHLPHRRRSRRGVALLVGVLAALGTGCGRAGSTHDGSVAAVIKGVDNPFFAAMSNGLADTARRRGARLRLEAATDLQDTAGQAAKLESLAADHAACYVVNPINQTNLVQALAHLPKGAPIVNIDSPVGMRQAAALGVKITSYIGTDNLAAGRLGAKAMATLVGKGARVAVIAGIPDDATSGARADGFSEAAGGRFDVVETVAADFDRGKAMLAAENLLRTDPALKGIFAVNDEMALGAADAVRAAGRTGKVAVIGVDGIQEALTAVKSGALSATVAQYPYTIGQLGVEACLAAVRGKPVPDKVDAPIALVTRDNVTRAQARFPAPAEPYRSPLAMAP